MNAKMGIPDKIRELVANDIPVLAKKALRKANPLYPVPVIFNREEMEKSYAFLVENLYRE